MSLLTRIVVRFLILAGLTTAVCVLIWLGVQQVSRQSANDPQIQVARDAAARLDRGALIESVLPRDEVDPSCSLAVFVTVFDRTGTPVASSGRIRGELRTPPSGVLDFVRQNGEERVTWQPERGVRIATVAVRFSNGVVLAGRSLAETEWRIQRHGRLIAAWWGAMMVGLLVAVAGAEYLLRKPAVV